MNNQDRLKQLNESFGSYRAEWLKNRIFDLFAEPVYFQALQDNRPCVLEGGRGTGKTTVLRSLSYQGQYAIHKNNVHKLEQLEFIGIYHRVDTNHVRAFTGAGVEYGIWQKIFSHYFNLLICREILLFIRWHSSVGSNDESFNAQTCKLICLSLCIEADCTSLDELIEKVNSEMYAFQSKINSILDNELPPLSMAGDPIKIITESTLNLTQFKGKIFFILLDEYENYEDYQQQIINSLIKHSTDHYTFKIAVREMGWRVKHTLNPLELLHDPADYVLINIEQKLTDGESQFENFAKTVCQQRLSKIFSTGNEQMFEIDKALLGYSIEEEAEVLGVKDTELYQIVNDYMVKNSLNIGELPSLYIFFIGYWNKYHNLSLKDTVNEYLRSKKDWDTRYENYKYDMLFKIRRGRGKRGIQKYYSGWSTYTKLSNGNIRYLMELVYKAFEKHLLDEKGDYSVVPQKTQTIAAQEVGHKNLIELEGLWKNGAQLTKLLLGLGRVFQVLAATEGKSAPEKNQFSIENSLTMSTEVTELVTAAVMNLALVRSPGNKLNSVTHTRDYIYMIHPIFSPFFEFSHRKKRKILITQEEFLGLIRTPKSSIKSVLDKSKTTIDETNPLPSQLGLFDAFYNKEN